MTAFEDCVRSLEERLRVLRDKPEETARTTLTALWQLAAGKALSCDACESQPIPVLNSAAEACLEGFIARRLAGEPLAYITGRQRFFGLEMLAEPSALIPRRETELLARAAVDTGRQMLTNREHIVAIDVCTGSGNLAASLAHYLPQARVFAADLSPEAIGLARRNARFLGLAGRIETRVGDLLNPFDEPAFHNKVDLLTCNPPYISTRKLESMPREIVAFEPAMAFDGGPLGVRIVQRLLREAPRYLASGGCLAFEVGSGQGPAVIKRMGQMGAYENVRGRPDSTGEIRAVLADRKRGEIL